MAESTLCPNCQANIEGLTHHCDCCGAALDPPNTLFSYTVYGTALDGLNSIFDKLDAIDPEPYADVLQCIDVDFWCFPTKRKSGATYYTSRKKAILTIQLDMEQYIQSSPQAKRALLVKELQNKLDVLHRKLIETGSCTDGLFKDIQQALK